MVCAVSAARQEDGNVTKADLAKTLTQVSGMSPKASEGLVESLLRVVEGHPVRQGLPLPPGRDDAEEERG